MVAPGRVARHPHQRPRPRSRSARRWTPPGCRAKDARARRALQPASAPTALGYLHLQSTRPQTLAYGLNDSPVGAAGVDRREVRGVDRSRHAAAAIRRSTATSCWPWSASAGSPARAPRRRTSPTRGCRRSPSSCSDNARGRRDSQAPRAARGRRGLRRRLQHPRPAGSRTHRRVVDRSTIAAGTSPRWRPPTCWSASSAGSSAP